MMSALLVLLLFPAGAATPFADVYGDEPGCRFCWVYEKAEQFRQTTIEKAKEQSDEKGQESDPKLVAKQKAVTPRRYRLLYFTAEWCGPCRNLKARFPWLKASGWSVGDAPDNHVQVVDIDRHPEVWSKWRKADTQIPLIVVIDGDREVRRMLSPSIEDFVTLFNAE